ncbi:MAG: hypothetical protein QXO12_03100, partial [Candidatus Pacearchaeota archaeon]
TNYHIFSSAHAQISPQINYYMATEFPKDVYNTINSLYDAVLRGFGNIILWVANAIKNFIFYLITFSNYFLQAMIDLNINKLKENNVLNAGWQLTRDVSNLLIIIITIIIALATILRVKEYEAKKLLVKLILIAILINFSLEICFIIIDFSHTLTLFFQKAANIDDINQLTIILNKNISLQKLLEYPNDDTKKYKSEDFLYYFFLTLITAFFIITFSLLTFFVITTYAIIFLIRYLYLTILLILFPGVLVLQMVPQFKKHTDQWWDKFFSWTFFAPISMFFLLLSFTGLSALNISISSESFLNIEDELRTDASDSLFTHFFNVSSQLLVILGFLLGGLIAAQQLGIKFAEGALKYLKTAQGNISKKIKEKSKQAGVRLGTSVTRIPGFDNFAKKLSTAGKDSNFLGRLATAPVRKLGTGLNKLQEARANLVKKAEEKDKNKTLKQRAMEFTSASAPHKIATLQAIAKEGKEKKKAENEAERKLNKARKELQDLQNLLQSASTPASKKTEIEIKINEKQNEIQDLIKEKDDAKKELENFKNEILSLLPKSYALALENTEFNLNKIIKEIKELKKTQKLKTPMTSNALKSYLSL